MPSVSGTPVLLGHGPALFQNLGSGNLFVGEEDVTTGTGVQVSDGEAVAVGFSNNAFYGVSDGTSDVRILGAGWGISSAPAP